MGFSEQEYFNYMNSPQWAEIKAKRKAIDGGKCCMCGSTQDLQIHHLTYRNFTQESPWTDVLTLCESCHKNVHVMMNRPTGRNEDGTMKHGWRERIPAGIAEALEARGLM